MFQMVKELLDERIGRLSHQIRMAHASGNDMEVFSLQRERTELQKERVNADQAFDKERFTD